MNQILVYFVDYNPQEFRGWIWYDTSVALIMCAVASQIDKLWLSTCDMCQNTVDCKYQKQKQKDATTQVKRWRVGYMLFASTVCVVYSSIY